MFDIRKLTRKKTTRSNKVRLDCERLDERTVPASLTFNLSGVYATATFTVPLNEVDPGEATQAIDLDNLTVMIDGEVAMADDFDDTPTANYAFGNFMGVSVTIFDDIPSPFTSIEIANNTATGYTSSPPTTATVLYNTADTQADFTLEDGTAGAISYDVPWTDVDPTEASQSLSLSNFKLGMAGRILTPSTANFTTSPTAQFEYGEMTGITFAINTSTIFGFPYSSVSASDFDLTAVNSVPASVEGEIRMWGSGTLDFTNATNAAGANGWKADITLGYVFEDETGVWADSFTYEHEFAGTATATDIATAFYADLAADGNLVIRDGATLTINGYAGAKLVSIQYKTYSWANNAWQYDKMMAVPVAKAKQPDTAISINP